MKAMILAAGLGTRLRPLTRDKPKPLVPFLGVPMLERIVLKLLDAGAERIVVNIHHFADQVIEFMKQRDYYQGRVVLSEESDRLLDTGGGLINARSYLENHRPFVLHNVDVHTNLNITSLYKSHQENEALVTVAVTDRQTTRSLLFDSDGCLSGWQHNLTGEQKIVRPHSGPLKAYANSCVHVIDQEFFRLAGQERVVSLTDVYLDLAAEHRIVCFVHNDDFWYNLGDYQSFLKAREELQEDHSQ